VYGSCGVQVCLVCSSPILQTGTVLDGMSCCVLQHPTCLALHPSCMSQRQTMQSARCSLCSPGCLHTSVGVRSALPHMLNPPLMAWLPLGWVVAGRRGWKLVAVSHQHAAQKPLQCRECPALVLHEQPDNRRSRPWLLCGDGQHKCGPEHTGSQLLQFLFAHPALAV
jgi:hypothetical protein